MQQVAQVDTEHLAVFERIERGLARRRRVGGLKRLAQPLPQGGGVQRMVSGLHLLENRQQAGMLHAQEVLPQEVTAAEHGGQRLQGAVLTQPGEVGAEQGIRRQALQELVEVLEGHRRIRGHGQKMRELLDRHDDEAQFLLSLVGGDLAAVAPAKAQLVLHLSLHTADVDPVHVKTAHGERVRQAVQKARRVFGGDVHDGPIGRRRVVDAHRHGKQPLRKVPAGGADGVDEAVIQRVARLLLLALPL